MGKKTKSSFLSSLGVSKKRVYTLTTPQYIAGFVISISFSMLFGPLFERYAPRYLSTVAYAINTIRSLNSEQPLKPAELKAITTIPIDSVEDNESSFEEIREKLKQLSKS